jgi:hypothetical protein
MPQIPGVIGSRRTLDEVDLNTGSMGTVPVKPLDPEFIKRVVSVKETFNTALDDVRFRIGGLTRQLLAQGKHLTMSTSEYTEAAQSIEALALTLEAASSLLESTSKVANAEVWISKDVEKIVKSLAALVHAATDLNAYRELSADKVQSTTQLVRDCAGVLRKGSDVLKLVREVTGIELGVNNLGVSTLEFKKLAGVSGVVETGPAPAELLGSFKNPVPEAEPTPEQLEALRTFRASKVQTEETKDMIPCSLPEDLGTN